MATNFEFYRDEILRITNSNNNFAVVNGKIKKCTETRECEDCLFFKHSSCVNGKIRWLYAEHIELPKLTKRERAFCEAVQTGWIARDNNGRIHWYSRKPYKSGEEWFYDGDRFVDFTNFNLFSCVKGLEETPYTVEDLLKLEVMEVQEDA